MVVSTICKGCQSYLKIENGIAIPPVNHEDNPRYQASSLPETTEKPSVKSTKPRSQQQPASKPVEAKSKKDVTPIPSAPPNKPEAAPKKKTKAAISAFPTPKKSGTNSAGADAPPAASIPQTQPNNIVPRRKPKPKAPPPPPKPEAITAKPKKTENAAKPSSQPSPNTEPVPKEKQAEEAKEKPSSAPERYRPQATISEPPKHSIAPLINREKKRSVKCFECEKEHDILADSTSALCPHCGAYIGLKDYDIRDQENSRIQTRGNVFVHKKGYVNGITIHAHNLTIEGEIEGGADCTGDFIVRKTGKINGVVKSDRVIIERRAEVDFLSTVEAREVIIDGHVTGAVACKKLTLKKRATLDGDLTVASLSVEEGAKHTGNIKMTGLL